MKEILEGMVNLGKKVGRKAVVTILTIGMLSTPVHASQLSNFLNANVIPGIQNSSAELTHHSIPALFNVSFIYGHTPAVDIFYGEDTDRKKWIGEPAESMDTKVASIGGRGLTAPKLCDLSANIVEAPFIPENNMIDKKVIQKLYDTQDTPETNDDILLGIYDAWNMTESGQKINLTVRNGISHLLETNFYDTNIADFNNDGDVNFEDFAMLANDWKKPIGNYLADISGPAGLSDGIVDEYDLAELAANWLNVG